MASKAEWLKAAKTFGNKANSSFAKTWLWLLGGIYCIFKAVARAWDGGEAIMAKGISEAAAEAADEDEDSVVSNLKTE